MSRRLLIVNYYHPPAANVGGNRWVAIAKYLRRAGHEVTFLSTNAYGALPDDSANEVVRASDVASNERLRRLLRRPDLPTTATTAQVVEKRPPALLSKVIVPDGYLLSFVPAALREARRIVRRRGVDCVITTSTPDSTHFVGMGMRDLPAAWIADFRDGWAFDAPRDPFPTRGQRALDVWLEGRVVRRADGVVAVSRPIVEDLCSRIRPDVRYVPSGWDRDLDGDVARAEPPELEPDTVSLVYTGKMSGVWGRHPGALFEAMRTLRAADPRLASRLRFVIAGRLDTEDERLVREAELGAMVRHVGMLPRASAAALQRRADALVLLTSPTLVWELPGKVLEYLYAGRPILALARGSEAGRVVEETGTGVVVSPTDVEEIVGALRSVLAGELERTYAPHGIEPFVHPAPAEAVAEEIERAIERRRQGRRRA